MAKHSAEKDQVIQFLRKRDYTFVKELGQGACGKTVLLHDEYIDQYYVCKKYSPLSEERRQELFAGFVKEIKLLHELQHRNVVRVFNHYLYPETFAGYILMEYVDGLTIDECISRSPEQANELFLQTIAGFSHLEGHGILHRDIRPENIMVCADGTVKIIDLGFGKRVHVSKDFEKSVSLNWRYEPPAEFDKNLYDFRTDVYFVGKLFEDLIRRHDITQFKYSAMLGGMCQRDPEERTANFRDVEQQIGSDQFVEIDFSEWQTSSYRDFAEAIALHITKIDAGASYTADVQRIVAQLSDVYRSCMLESMVPDCAPVLRCFISGTYYYKKEGMRVEWLKGFVRLLKTSGEDKARVILANLHSRLDALPRYKKELDIRPEDIPF